MIGNLYRMFNSSESGEVKQVIVPKDFRDHVMKLAHESIVGGHLGARKTADRITSSFHWPEVMSDVNRFCRSCDICWRVVPKRKVTRVPLGVMPVMEEPFSSVAVDLNGPLSPVSDKGNCYVLTIVDYTT